MSTVQMENDEFVLRFLFVLGSIFIENEDRSWGFLPRKQETTEQLDTSSTNRLTTLSIKLQLLSC